MTAPRISDAAGNGGVELWPSVGEYPVYDAFIYYVMSHDTVRNPRYRDALLHTCRGRVVVDIGTGQDLLWAREAVAAGARHVYAIESLPHAAAKAEALCRKLGLDAMIDVITGLSQQLTLPEAADVCIVEMVGSIGSAEGIAAVAGDARNRLVCQGGIIIPARVATNVCGITLPDDLYRDPGFTVDAADYVEQIWARMGTPSDVRLAIRGIQPDNVLTSAAEIENLDLCGRLPDAAANVAVSLRVERSGRLDGLLLWTRAWPLADAQPLETFPTAHSGLPAYVPLFYPGVDIAPAGGVDVGFRRRLCPDGVHPDYCFESVVRNGSVEVAVASVQLPYLGGILGQNGFYAALCTNGP
jgi:type I protein arginine methyltransferase